MTSGRLPPKVAPSAKRKPEPKSDEGAPRGQWNTIEAALIEAKRSLNDVCVDLHPQDREVFAERMAQSCTEAKKRMADYNDKHGVPERAEGGLRKALPPTDFLQ